MKKSGASLVIIACLTQIVGVVGVFTGPFSAVFWLISASVGASFLVLVAIWQVLTNETERQAERERERKAFSFGAGRER